MAPTLQFPPPARPAWHLPSRADIWRRVFIGIAVPLLEILSPLNPDRRAALRLDLAAWIVYYFPHLRSMNPFQARFVQQMQDLVLHGPQLPNLKALAAPRGGGKTTIAQLAVLWAVLNGHVRFVMFLTANGDKATERISTIKEYLLRNQRLLEDYPEICQRIVATQGDSHKADPLHPMKQREMRLSNGVWLVAHGMDSGIAGALKVEQRPDFIIFDDVESNIRTEAERKTLLERFQVALGLPSQDARTTVLWICTIPQPESLSAELTDAENNPTWRGERYRALMREPAREDLWEAYMGILRPNERRGRAEQIDDAARPAWSMDSIYAGVPVIHAADAQAAAALEFDRKAWDLLPEASKRAYRFYLANQPAMDAGMDVLDRQALPAWKIYQLRAVYGERFYRCELQNDPPPADDTQQLEMHILDARRVSVVTWQNESGRKAAICPSWAACLLATVDMGKNRIHWEVDAWDVALATSMALDCGIIHTQVDLDQRYRKATDGGRISLLQAAIRSALTRLAAQLLDGYPDETGKIQPIRKVGIDCGGQADGYAWMHDVLVFCAQQGGRWVPLKGRRWTDADAMRHAGMHWRRPPVDKNPYGRVDADSDYYKDLLFNALQLPVERTKEKGEKPGAPGPFPGTRILAQTLDVQYLRQQMAERRDANGHWEPAHGAHDNRPLENHYFDTAYNQYVLADLLRSGAAAGRPRRKYGKIGQAFKVE